MNHGHKPGHVSTATNINKDKTIAETANTNASSMFRGLICVLDDYRFYGYVTNTAVKIIVAVKDDILTLEKELGEARDDMIRSLLSEIHDCYVGYRLNPFSAKYGRITSTKFITQMNNILCSGSGM